MFDLLCRRLPPRWAAVVLLAWYVLLLVGVAWCWNVKSSDFRYGAL